jgi:hypothetical protein
MCGIGPDEVASASTMHVYFCPAKTDLKTTLTTGLRTGAACFTFLPGSKIYQTMRIYIDTGYRSNGNDDALGSLFSAAVAALSRVASLMRALNQ